MTILDSALSQFAGVDIAGIAAKVGLSDAQVQSVIGAVASYTPEPGSAVGVAATQTNLPVEKVQAVIDAIGGEAMMARITGALSQGGGNPSILSGLFGKS